MEEVVWTKVAHYKRAVLRKMVIDSFLWLQGAGQKVTIFNEQGKLWLDTRKILLSMRVVKQWNWLPREIVVSSSLEVSKCRLDKGLARIV